MVTMSSYRQNYFELAFKDRLSVADAVVLEHRLGLTKAANFVAEVDPWCYPHDDTPATLIVKKMFSKFNRFGSTCGQNDCALH